MFKPQIFLDICAPITIIMQFPKLSAKVEKNSILTSIMSVSLCRGVTMISCGSVLALSVVLLAVYALMASAEDDYIAVDVMEEPDLLPAGCQIKLAGGGACNRKSYEHPAQGKLFTLHLCSLLCNNKPTLGTNPTQSGQCMILLTVHVHAVPEFRPPLVIWYGAPAPYQICFAQA